MLLLAISLHNECLVLVEGDEVSKPEWSESPEWVMWMAQDKDGVWFGYDNKPDDLEDEWGRLGANVFDNCGRCILLERGNPSSKWRKTLESRP